MNESVQSGPRLLGVFSIGSALVALVGCTDPCTTFSDCSTCTEKGYSETGTVCFWCLQTSSCGNDQSVCSGTVLSGLGACPAGGSSGSTSSGASGGPSGGSSGGWWCAPGDDGVYGACASDPTGASSVGVCGQ